LQKIIGTGIMSGHCFVVKVVTMILCMNIVNEIIAIAPRTEALETPIDVVVETTPIGEAIHIKQKQ
jgi:hypothetical protein